MIIQARSLVCYTKGMKANYRLLIVLAVTILVLTGTYLLGQFAKGYRPDLKNGGVKVTGLLVATSDPKGAQVYVNGKLQTATDDTLNFDPGNYLVEIKKEGFIPWKKQLHVYPELVTETNALLFPTTPNLQAVTNSGALNPVISPSGTKIAYVIPKLDSQETTVSAGLAKNLKRIDKTGLWLLELTNLPLGFNQGPKQLVSGRVPVKGVLTDWKEAEISWSPDSRQLLAVFKQKQQPNDAIPKTATKSKDVAVFLINTGGEVVKANLLTNSLNRKEEILAEWSLELNQKQENQLAKLPLKFADFTATAAANLIFSPDETKLLYTATASAQLMDHYIPAVPAASTQKQARKVNPMQTYVYDLKEDRNFLILNEEQTMGIQKCKPSTNDLTGAETESNDLINETDQQPVSCPNLMWFPTSRHLVYVADNKVSIREYDNTNNQVIYSGPLDMNFVFTHPSTSKLLIVTNLNPDAFPLPNIYTLSLR